MVPLMSLRQFTDPAQRVMAIAEEEAVAGNANAVSTGHVLLAMLRERGCIAASALASLGVTVEAVQQHLADMSLPAEDGPSSYGISRRLTFTRMTMGTLSNARIQLPKTGHLDESEKHTPEGYPYLCTGEILLALINVAGGAIIGKEAAAALQVLATLGIDLPWAYTQALDVVRRFPAGEPAIGPVQYPGPDGFAWWSLGDSNP
jgi:hypothetical protein